jgi:hypothetical protein
MLTRLAIFSAFTLLNFQAGALAEEHLNLLLRGAYRISSNSFCEQTSRFGDPPTFVLLDFGSSIDDHSSGVITFDGTGSATEVDKGFYKSEFYGTSFPGATPAGTFESVCTHTYVVNKDRSFTLNGFCDSVVTSGGGPTPRKVHVSGIRSAGQIDRQGDVLAAMSADDHIITLEDSVYGVFQRRCGASFTAIRILHRD